MTHVRNIAGSFSQPDWLIKEDSINTPLWVHPPNFFPQRYFAGSVNCRTLTLRKLILSPASRLPDFLTGRRLTAGVETKRILLGWSERWQGGGIRAAVPRALYPQAAA